MISKTLEKEIEVLLSETYELDEKFHAQMDDLLEKNNLDRKQYTSKVCTVIKGVDTTCIGGSSCQNQCVYTWNDGSTSTVLGKRRCCHNAPK